MSIISEIKDLQDEVREGYMPEKQTAPDFGEPWKNTYFDEQRSDNRTKYYCILPGDLSRAVACVNACAGMADPSAEIQAMRVALSGRTVSCSQCNEAAKQIEAMQEAIKEAHDALDNCVEFIQDAQIIEAQWRWEPVKQSKAALAKLQPFLP